MDRPIIEKLAIAEQFAHNARFAGTPRQAVGDGYSSIDALLSAVLLEAGSAPPRNHKHKLDAVRRLAPTIFDTRQEQVGGGFSYMGGLEWGEIEAFYREWLRSRYDSFDLPSGQVRQRVAITLSANTFAIRWLAERQGEDWLAVQEAVNRAAYGYDVSETVGALSAAHDHLFSEAEQFGERVGRKLGTKMSSATNFCDADIIAGDDITRELIEHDQEIARHASAVYVGFCRLMEQIRAKRLDLILDRDPTLAEGEALDSATEFVLALKARYHGERLSDTGEAIAEALSHSFARLLDRRDLEEDPH